MQALSFKYGARTRLTVRGRFDNSLSDLCILMSLSCCACCLYLSIWHFSLQYDCNLCGRHVNMYDNGVRFLLILNIHILTVASLCICILICVVFQCTFNVNTSHIKSELRSTYWDFVKEGTVNEAADKFIGLLWDVCVRYIPRSAIKNKRSTHPWLNDQCCQAISLKAAAEGANQFVAARDSCAQTLQEAFKEYHSKI